METVENVLRGRGKDEEVPQNKITVKIEDRPPDRASEEPNWDTIKSRIGQQRQGVPVPPRVTNAGEEKEYEVEEPANKAKPEQTAEAPERRFTKRVVYDPAMNEVKVIDVDTGMIEDSYSARSGPVAPPGGYKKGDKQRTMGEEYGTITPGTWIPEEPPRIKKPGDKNYNAMLDQCGNSWFQWIVPYNEALDKRYPEYKLYPNRTEIGFHPDGNVPGTDGCIGILEGDTTGCYDWWVKNWSHTIIEVIEGRGGITKWELEKMDKMMKGIKH